MNTVTEIPRPSSLPLTISAASALLRSGQRSAVELAQSFLDRIVATETRINAFITVTAEEALAAARHADRVAAQGDEIGPLHGIPVAVKDNIDTAGVRTTVGSPVFADNIPTKDATVVERLRNAGAIIVGKTNMHEFAWGGTTENEHFGTTRNPWDLTRNANGSSGGSAAAIAAGQCIVAIGTDTGGSVRNPAAVTGLTGLRPTVGRVSNAGVFPLAWSMDTVGPIARTAKDVALVHSIIAGPDSADPAASTRPLDGGPTGPSLSGQRIGIIRDFALGNIDDGVRFAMERALDDLTSAGAIIVDLDVPGVIDYYSSWLIIHTAEPSALHRHLLAAHRDQYGADVRGQLHAGQAIPAVDYILAQRYRQQLREQFLALFDTIDAMVMPTAPTPATAIGENPRELALRRGVLERPRTFFTGLASTLAMPALSLPIGTSENLPVGMQIMGRPFDESGLLSLGIAYQEVTHWHEAIAPF